MVDFSQLILDQIHEDMVPKAKEHLEEAHLVLVLLEMILQGASHQSLVM